MSEIARRLRIHGRVQGVCFRAWTVESARGLGLRGWVRNSADGTVEVLVQGPPAQVEQLIRLCREGPPQARIDRIEAEEARAETLDGFEKWATQ